MPGTDLSEACVLLAGQAPKLPKGLEPGHVARRIIEAIEAGETEVPSQVFLTGKKE